MTTITVGGDIPARPVGNHPAGTVRTCDTTGLPVCLTAQYFIKLHAVVAVVFLLVGGIGALLLALTRWPAVHLLSAPWYYRVLTLHGLNMLIFWILNFEIAILYFVGPLLLNCRLFSAKLAWVAFGLMLVGALMVDVMIMAGNSDVLMTSYVPLRAHPLFYLGIILMAVGSLVGVINFFGTHLHRQAGPHLRGLGSARRVRRDRRGDHRRRHAAARCGRDDSDLPLVARVDIEHRPLLVPVDLVGPRPHVPAGQRLRDGVGLVPARHVDHRREAAQRSPCVAAPSCSTSCSSTSPRPTICWSIPASARRGRSGTPRTRCTSRCSPR